MRKILACSTIVLILTLRIQAQDRYDFRHYGVENGLSNNNVLCILQDKKGFMWFGTRDGLNRFDGYTFKSSGMILPIQKHWAIIIFTAFCRIKMN